MRAIRIREPGGPDVLELAELPLPEPGRGEVRVRVHATAVNRADLLQRMGLYPAPRDVPEPLRDVPGLELAGVVEAIGPGVGELAPGDRVFGLVGGGAYAEAVVAHERELARVPEGVDLVQAAAIPEAFVTAYDAMVTQAGLQAGEHVLITAVGSGVGSAAVQIARAIGAVPLGTTRTAEKLERARALGLAGGVVTGRPSGGTDPSPGELYAHAIVGQTGGRGVDVVLELVAGAMLDESLRCLAERGRLVIVGLLGGVRGELDQVLVLRRRLTVRGTVLRSRPLEEKILAGRLLDRHIAPLVAAGALRPVVDRVYPLEQAAEAHAYLAKNESFGKVVLTVGGAG